MRHNTIRAVRYFMVLAVLALTAGCSQKSPSTPEPVKYRLKWLFNVSVVGDLWADVHGLFAQQGLAVEVKAGGPERDAIKELEIGHAQFGVASADQVIRAVSKGAPIVVLAQLFQANPLQWIYRPDETRLEGPADLKQKVIGITFGGNDETIMRALLNKHQIKEGEVQFFSVRYDYTPFYQRQVALWPIYQNAQGVVIGDKLRRAGEPVGFFNPNQFGIRFVANSVVTSEKMMKEHPETVKKFISALLQGWRTALDPANVAEAVATIHKFDPDTSLEIIEKQLEATRVLMTPPPGLEIGSIDTEAWKQTEQIMLAQKMIPAPIGVEKFLKPPAEIAKR